MIATPNLFVRTTAARWLLIISLLLGGGLCALLLKADRRITGASAASARQPLPAMQGQPAVDYLKEHGMYDRLHESIEASRYQLERLPLGHWAGKGATYRANNPAQHLQASFSDEQMRLQPVQGRGRPHWQMGLKLRGVGYGAQLNAVTAGPLRAIGNRVEYDHALLQSAIGTKSRPQSAIKEWYVNTKEGIEQGFTLHERPGLSFGGEPLRLALTVTGELRASLENEGQMVILARRDGLPVLRYDHLVAYDALGRALPARMEVRGAEIALVVEDAAAVYPLTIDPLFSEVKKLTASDGAAGDGFGLAVALSGDTAVVGAWHKNSNTGAVYVFERNQGGADNWGQVKKLSASDAATGDRFGVAVGISGDTVVAGSQGKSGNNGAAYVFARNQGGADNWGEVKKLTRSDPASLDNFGNAVAISGDTVLVAAFNKNSSTGAAYIYERNQGGTDNWGQVKKLTHSDAAVNDFFGTAVGISGDTAVIGAGAKNSETGAAYIFERNQGGANNWGQVKKLTHSDPVGFDRFGYTIGISTDTVVVGSYFKNSQTGAAYIFERNRGGADNWGEVKKLTASDGIAVDRFGWSVGISGDRVVVGARSKNSSTGAAYTFERNQGGADNWGEAQILTASDAAASDQLGFAVGISGDTVLAGASGKNASTGAAYLFTNQCGQWTEIKKPAASDAEPQDRFGQAVAISGDTMVVGAFLKGAAYIFERNQGGPDNWGEVKKLLPSEGPPSQQFGISVALGGDTVVVGANGKDTSTGAAYLFRRNQGGANNWGEVKILTASDAAMFDQFGCAVGISGDTVVAGARFKNEARGAAYIFERNQGGADNWGEVKKLTSGFPAVDDQFGFAVSLSGDTVAVAANATDGFIGGVFIFQRNLGGADNWGHVTKVTASDGEVNDYFGWAVALSGDTLVASTYFKNDSTGAAYIFARNQGGIDNWGEVKKLTASDGLPLDRFGLSVGIHDDTVVIGAPSSDNEMRPAGGMTNFIGAVYLYERNQGGADNWGQIQKLVGSDSAQNDHFGQAVALSDDTLVIGADGKNNSTGATYLFEVACPVFSTPTITKDFSPAMILAGGTSTVTLTLTNPNASPLTNAAFTDTLANMSAVGGAVGGTCTGTTPGSLTAGATALSFSGISIPASGSCTVSFEVTSNTPGVQPNQTSGVTTAQTAAGDPSNTANLTVTCPTIVVSPATVPEGRIYQPYPVINFSASSQLRPAGSVVPYTFMLTGTLPAGLNFANGVLSGTPTQAGSFNFTITATETATGCTGSTNYTLIIKRGTVKADFDGDGKTDLSVWLGNLSPAPWRIINSSDGSMQSIDWGTAQSPINDEIVPGDYDGDGKTDVAVFRRSNGHWYIQRSSDGGITDEFWGLGTDEPVPGDYDGDGKTDVAVFRVSANAWYIKQSSDGMTKSETWGTAGDTPVPGDYDGDGKTDVAVWRGAVGGWYIKKSSDGMIKSETWGTSAAPHFDVPVPADYDGDGKYDVAVWRGAMTNWYILKSSDGQTQTVSWGTSAAPYFDVPVPGDYDGDGKADVAVWRPLDGNWLVIRSSDGTNLIQQHGQSGDTPVPSKGAH